jgi:peptidase C25-like protein
MLRHLLFAAMLAASLARLVQADQPAPSGKTDGRKPEAPLFIIVAPDRFHPDLKEYIQQKQKLFRTELVSLEGTLKAHEGVDDPERLKHFLYDAWRNKNLHYVLLVGDIDIFPVRYMVLDRATPAAFDYAFYPSDLYYADLSKSDGSFGDWNGRKDGFHAKYFGEVRGEKNKNDPINFDQIKYRPDIAVGRWPVSTNAEVRLIAAKSLAYEKSILDGSHPGLRKVAFFHPGGWVDARSRIEGIASQMPAGWKSERFLFSDGNANFKTPAPDEKNVVSKLNEGECLVVHVGHGSENTWHGCFGVNSLKQVKNADRLPVMISTGCSTGYFAPLPPYEPYVDIDGKAHKGTDHGEVFTAPPPPPAPYQKGKYNPTGLGEQVLKRGRDGAVVYIGCNTGSQPCGLTLLDGFMSALGKSEHPLVGDCWKSAVNYYYVKERLADLKPNNDWYPPSIFFQAMKFMLFGDPTLPLPPPEKTKG